MNKKKFIERATKWMEQNIEQSNYVILKIEVENKDSLVKTVKDMAIKITRW